MTAVKICGITNLPDALAAVAAGADALGFIFAPSPREITPEVAGELITKLPPFVIRVGVITGRSGPGWRRLWQEGLLDLMQVHGELDDPGLPRRSGLGRGRHRLAWPWRKGYRACSLTGTRRGRKGTELFVRAFPSRNLGPPGFSWRPASENIRAALKWSARGVDVGSGVESRPGRKDPGEWRSLSGKYGLGTGIRVRRR